MTQKIALNPAVEGKSQRKRTEVDSQRNGNSNPFRAGEGEPFPSKKKSQEGLGQNSHVWRSKKTEIGDREERIVRSKLEGEKERFLTHGRNGTFRSDKERC